ncbi:F-box/FBD/LRR-repeat protein At5g56420 [Lolium perenne]|uniref:F-box/FBD/LRR-repeat protein At5g56420 n=1 Tax=Lolium perenne TaxID=4522 RepID=UPI0021F61624|nr:F-box/FBD/LRR-repeat protein At5g56420-like [Lolium perenne]
MAIRPHRGVLPQVNRYACLMVPTCAARQLFDRTPPRTKDEATWTPSGPDGISALPDDVIHHVLGFLPAHDALQTSALARRWRNHWKWMHSLRFAAVSGSVSVVVLKRLVDRLLLDIRAPLDECVIDIQGLLELTEEVGRLIRHAVSEFHVRVLKVSLERQVVSGHPLVSGNLVRLELHHVTVEGTILDFSSCTALEDVVMTRAHIHATKISSPSLKRLRMKKCYLFPSVYSATCISAPSLVLMELDDLSVTTPLLERMPMLETAFVRLGHSWTFRCELRPTWLCCGVCAGCIKFYLMELGSLSSARHLELTAPSVKFTVLRCPTFSKLTTLLLNEWCLAADFGALSCILQHSPILEKLTLLLNQAQQETYNTMEQLPTISKCLKVVEIKCTKLDDRLYDFFKILKIFLGREHLRYNLTSGQTEIPLKV